MNNNIKEMIRKSYNKNANLRSSIIPDWKRNEINKFLSQINDDKLKLLDLGAGSGTFAENFTKKGLDVYCIDISKSMIDICLSKDLKGEVMDFYNLDFEPEQFDLIWSMNTLLHVPKKDIHIVLDEVQRVLKKNGIFYLGLYGGVSTEGIYEEDIYEPKRFFAFYLRDELLDIVKSHFKVIKCDETILDGDRNFLSMILTSKEK
ncbi:class I SAM-dependent methyltransferase [Vallitalea guaymasensis]|uniref:class I SAM-dependent methyltransferase n=1 Tax=Vallitalea guaymasensis TaxID=1185412 RepID=UPI000DE3FD40|nr:class I SAM-dependent methyltransferase [Vallitalea guaymasensis]